MTKTSSLETWKSYDAISMAAVHEDTRLTVDIALSAGKYIILERGDRLPANETRAATINFFLWVKEW